MKSSAYWRLPLQALLVISLLSACSNLQQSTGSDWPQELPPASFFVAAYKADTANHEHQSLQKYLYWVRRFYEGTTLYPNGWHDLSEDVLAATPDPDLARVREQKLFKLGRDIAAEWSKDSVVNRVDSNHLAVWGVAAGRAVEENTVDETLQMISEDVQKLLSLELEPNVITEERYHPQDPDDEFAL
ncbi:MAG: hypothetical protein AB8B48_20095 [Pseudomonadales bacterium]